MKIRTIRTIGLIPLLTLWLGVGAAHAAELVDALGGLAALEIMHHAAGEGDIAALDGDYTAGCGVHDYIEENALALFPFENGQSYLICTATLYYLGRVEDAGFGFVR